jgi:hypothetical protein
MGSLEIWVGIWGWVELAKGAQQFRCVETGLMLKQGLNVGVGVPVSGWWVPQRRLEGHAGLWEPWETLPSWAETQNGGVKVGLGWLSWLGCLRSLRAHSGSWRVCLGSSGCFVAVGGGSDLQECILFSIGWGEGRGVG